jgi:hypothetical protein
MSYLNRITTNRNIFSLENLHGYRVPPLEIKIEIMYIDAYEYTLITPKYCKLPVPNTEVLTLLYPKSAIRIYDISGSYSIAPWRTKVDYVFCAFYFDPLFITLLIVIGYLFSESITKLHRTFILFESAGHVHLLPLTWIGSYGSESSSGDVL